MIVLPVRSYKSHKNDSKVVSNSNDQSVFIATNVKDYPILSDKAGATILPLDLMRPSPTSFLRLRMPSSQGLLRIPALRSDPELPQPLDRDHPHRLKHDT